MTLIGWKYSKEIIITNTSSTDLESHPVRLILNSSNFDFDKADKNGHDIKFYDLDDNVMLDYYIEKYDRVHNEAIIWIKISYLPSSASKTIRMYYGAEGVTYSSDNKFVKNIMFEFVPDPFNDNSCVAYYPFDRNLKDYTGHGYDGISHYNGCSYVDGIIGQACRPVDGHCSYISIPSIVSDQWTISVWMRRIRNFNHYMPVIGYNFSNIWSYYWVFGFHNNYISFGSNHIYNTKINKWYHTALIYKGESQFDIYVDGRFIQSFTSNKSNLNKINQLGAFQWTSSYYAKSCDFDNLHIFSRILSQNEIEQLSQPFFNPEYTFGNEQQHKSKLFGVACDKYGIPIIDKPVKVSILDKNGSMLITSTTTTTGYWEFDNFPADPGSKVLVVYSLEGHGSDVVNAMFKETI